MTQSGNQAPQQPAPPPPAAPGWAPAPKPVVGPAGLVYGDVPNRVFAIIIDAIILAVVQYIVQIILFSIFGTSVLGVMVSVNILGVLLLLVADLAISIGYFTYFWTQRATIGMRALGLQIGDASDGHTLDMNQSLRRALVMWGPAVLGQFLSLSGAYLLSGMGGLMSLLGLILGLGWPIYLLYTTSQSPTKQGFHDVYAHTMVVKAARNVA